MFNQSRSLFLGSLAALAVTATVVHADVGAATGPTVSVVYSQKDLTSAHGVQTLYARLKKAARQVCADVDSRDLTRAVPARLCYETALAHAVEHIRRPELTALHVQAGNRSAG